MHIEPVTMIQLFKNIPCDVDYRNTLYFANVTAQTSYFNGKVFSTHPRNTYNRVTRNYCRVQAHIHDVYNCNYMRFRNPNFGGKWFYAFILNCEYVNAETVEINYQIDVIQTWYFEINWNEKQFISRMHDIHDYNPVTSTHEQEVNTQQEPVEVDELIMLEGKGLTELTKDFYLVLVYAVNDLEYFDVINLGGATFARAMWDTFDAPGVAGIIDKVNEFVRNDSTNSIVGCWILPKFMIDHRGSATQEKEIPFHKDFGGYVPKNNKLYGYPYSYLIVDNSSGDNRKYRFENFETLEAHEDDELCTVKFRLNCCISCNPSVYTSPVGYENNSGEGQTDYTAFKRPSVPFGLTLNNFPMVALPIDATQAAIAQFNSTYFTNVWDTTMDLVNGSMAMGRMKTNEEYYNPQSATSGAINSVENIAGRLVNIFQDQVNIRRKSGEMFGTQSNVDSIFFLGEKTFYFMRMGLSPRTAQRVDEFFTRFGYAQNKLMPLSDISHRQRYSYVQTQSCALSGSIPSDDIRNLENIFDNGITFWKDHNNVGNYDIDNPCV